jgi:LDH2 family malate/lactate/ureidoglycolate dehydrogenase
MFLAISVERFMPVNDFRSRMESLVAMVKSAAPSPDYDEVLVAGEPEIRAEAVRTRDGIPIQAGTWQALTEAGTRLGVPEPTVNCL